MGFSCKFSLKPIHWNQLLINSMDSQCRFFFETNSAMKSSALQRRSSLCTRIAVADQAKFVEPIPALFMAIFHPTVGFSELFWGVPYSPFPQYVGDNWGWSNSACHFSEPISQISFYAGLESSFYRSRSEWSSLVFFGHVTREMLMNRDMLSSKADA